MPTGEGLEKVQRQVLVVLAIGITLLFLWMIRDFLMALLLAALAAGLFHPIYRGVLGRVGGRPSLAAGLTVGSVLLLVVIPLVLLIALVTAQAVQVSQTVRPWLSEQLHQATPFDLLFEHVPALSPYKAQIQGKLGELAGAFGGFFVTLLTAAARETATFFLLLFVLLYAMFFFLTDGRAVLRKILYYLPLPTEDENRMVARFVSVARATLKGTLVIGLVQGGLGGLAFWVAGISGWAFWGAIMAVLSTVPGLGTAIVWVPAAAFLAIAGEVGKAVLLALFCIIVVGTVDNLLRPWLVGKDTKLPDLLVLISTLGGLMLFGAVGFIIGPIVAALFVTVWDLYAEAFANVLPPVSRRETGPPPEEAP